MEKRRVHTFKTKKTNHPEMGFDITHIDGNSSYENIEELLTPHTHDYYFVLIVRQAEGLHFIDCERHLMGENSVFFITPGQCHAYDPRKITDGYALSFLPDFYQLNKPIDKIYDFPFFHTTLRSPVLFMKKNISRIFSLLQEIEIEFLNNDFGQQSVIRSLLEILLVQLSRAYGVDEIEHDTTARINTSRIRKLECLIDMNFVEQRKVSFYSEKLNLTSRHLNNIVKTGTGRSISDMITSRVLAEAKRLLLNSDDTVAEIAWKLNFSDKAYFHRLFKTNTNYTPEGFRNKFLNVH